MWSFVQGSTISSKSASPDTPPDVSLGDSAPSTFGISLSKGVIGAPGSPGVGFGPGGMAPRPPSASGGGNPGSRTTYHLLIPVSSWAFTFRYPVPPFFTILFACSGEYGPDTCCPNCPDSAPTGPRSIPPLGAESGQ